MRDFYSRGKENKGSFVNKIEGLAKLAGIVTLGVASRPYWSRVVGKIGTEIAERLPNNLTSNTVKGVLDAFGGEEANSFFKFPEEVRKFIATAVTRTKKAEGFLGALEAHIDDTTLEAYRANKSHFSQFLSPIGKIGDISESEFENVIASPSTLRYLNREFHKKGVKFKPGFEREQRKIFESIVAQVSNIEPTEEEIHKFIGSQENRNILMQAFESLHSHQQKRLNFIRKNADYSSHVTELTFGDLHHPETAAKVDEFLDKVAMPGHKPVTVEDILKEAKSLRSGDKGIFITGRAGSTALPDRPLDARFEELFKSTTTGLAVDKKSGKVLSIAKMRTSRVNFLENLLEEVQLPLIPFAFSVPLKTFRFLKPSSETVKYLGLLGRDPELRKELGKMGMKDLTHMHGMGVGDRLLTIDGQAGKLSFVDRKITSYNRRENNHIDKMLNVRDQEVGSFIDNLGNFRGAEDNFSEKFKRRLYSALPKVTNLSYHPDHGFIVTPKANAPRAVVHSLIKKAYGTTHGVDINLLHPTQLADFLMGLDTNSVKTFVEHRPQDLRAAYGHVFKEGKQERIDMQVFLAKLREGIERDLPFDSNSPIDYHIKAFLKDSGSSHQIYEHLGTKVVGSSLEGTDTYNRISPSLYKALNTLQKDDNALYQVTQSESGFIPTLASNIIGQKGLGQAHEKFQEGVLSEAIRSIGIGQLDQEAGMLRQKGGIVNELQRIRMSLEEGTLTSESLTSESISKHFRDLGIIDPKGAIDIQSLTSVMKQMTKVTDTGVVVSREELGKFAAIVMDRGPILKLTNNPIEKLKILDDARQAMSSFDAFRDEGSPMFYRQLQILHQMSEDVNLGDTLRTRFSSGRQFYPQAPQLSPTNINNYMTVMSDAPDALDFAEDPLGSLFKQIKRGFGVREFIQGATDPNAALGTHSMAAQILLQMPQEIANAVGLGLTGQDRITSLRSTIGFYGKRVLPLVVGYEAYKNYNANMHALHLPGLDDMAANLLANLNLTAASVKDVFGITEMNKTLVNSLPGLDKYFSPRTRDEYEEYLAYGDEEVRQGRGWIIGNRGEATGGQIKGFRPNYYRRWKSHWTELQDISNPVHSFLPNLQNPIAPLTYLYDRFTDNHWWMQKHVYEPASRGFSPSYVGESKDVLAINSLAGGSSINFLGQGGALGTGEMGGGFPTAMGGAGVPISLDRKGNLIAGIHGLLGIGGSGWGGDTGDPIQLGVSQGVEKGDLQHGSIGSFLGDQLEAARTQAGLFGAVAQRLPFWPESERGLDVQNPLGSRSFSRMAWFAETGEFTGAAGEFFRRFVQPEVESYDAYSPFTNDAPSWLPNKYKTGYMYSRTPYGELNLPGKALEAATPWVRPLKVRGSSIGGTEEEIIQKWLNPLEGIEGDDAQDIVDFGSAVHLQLQRQLNEMGALVGAEVSIYDKEHNISGTIDAVARGQGGMEVLEFKTQGDKSWGTTPEKYKDQLTFYMATTGIKKGKLIFVNRDHPDIMRTEEIAYDEGRWQNILAKIDRARGTMEELQKSGAISPFEAYDLVSRIEILSKVAPESAEFRKHVAFALKGGLNNFEEKRVQEAVRKAEALSKDYNLYPKVYGVDTETRRLTVRGVTSDGNILTDYGTLKFAGVEMDPQAFNYEDANTKLESFGIHVGKKIPVTLIKGQFNSEVMNDMVTPAIIGSVNQKLVNSGTAEWTDGDKNPLAIRARYGQNVFASMWEKAVHGDNLITNKFMRVRTPLEQFERGEVYGTDKARWDDITHTIIAPTLNSIFSKNPLAAAAQSAILASMFVRSNSANSKLPHLRSKVAVAAAAVGATIATMRSVIEIGTHSKWVPERYEKQGEFDEYWDILKYLKYTAVSEFSKKMAKKKEHIDIDKAVASDERTSVGLGPWAVLAIDADRKAKRTMYGINEATASLQDALEAIPERQRQIAEELITTGTLKEKSRFYDLLPDEQKRVLGKFLNIDYGDLPLKPNLTKYFKTHFLPNVDWAGWNVRSDMEDLKTRSGNLEGMRIDNPSRTRVNKARSRSHEVAIPRMDNPTRANIENRLRELISSGGYQHLNMKVDLKPSDSSTINVDVNVFEDQTSSLLREMRKDLY